MLKRLSHFNTVYPRRVLAFWLVLFLMSIPFSGQIASVLNNDPGLAPNSDTHAFRSIIENEFVSQTDYQLILTAEAAETASLTELQQAIEQTASTLRELEWVEQVETAGSEPLIPDFQEDTRVSLVLIALSTNDREAVLEATAEIMDTLPQEGLLRYNLTGWPVVDHELQQVINNDSKRAELGGLTVSLLVLLFVFGAVIAATLPILVAIMSISLSLAVLFFVGQVYPIASFGQLFVSLLGLATGIDYALLIVNRFREELAKGLNPKEAAKQTTLSAGKAVGVSGLTVLIALSALLIPPLSFIRSMGIASVTAMFFSLAISISALPALLSLLGHRVNWIRLSRREPGTRTRHIWLKRAQTVMQRPRLWTIIGLSILIILSLPAGLMQIDFGGAKSLTGQNTIKAAADALEKLELDSLQRSIDVLIPFEGDGFFQPSSVRDISTLTRDTREFPNVDYVLSPLTTTGVPRLLVYQYYATSENALGGL